MRKLLALATVLSGLIPATVSFQAVNAAVVDTGTDGVAVNLDVTALTTVDGVTGSGDLTLTTPNWVVNDATTYGTAQLATGATFTDFTGGVKLGGAVLDVNGNSFTTKYIQSLTQDVDGTATQDASSSIINTATMQSVLTMTEASNLYATFGNADGTNSDIKLVWDTTGTRQFRTQQFHTGGISATGGVLELYSSVGENVDFLGTGAITLDNTNVYASNGKTYRLSNAITLKNNVGFRQCSNAMLYLSGEINGDGNLRVNYDGSQVVLEGVAKTYTGKTVIGSTSNAWNDGGAVATLGVATDNVLPVTTTVEMVKANGGANLNMNGTTQTVAGLAGAGRVYGNGSATLNVSSDNVSGNFTVDGTTLNLAQTLENKNLTLRGSGKVNFAGGTIVTQEMNIANMYVNGDTEISISPAQWGKTVLSGNFITTGAVYPMEFSDDTDMLNTSDQNVFPQNTTISYSGYIMLDNDQTLSFRKIFDDNGQVAITPINEDGTLGETIIALRSANGTELVGTVIAQTGGSGETWDDVVVGSVNLSAGRYLIDIRGGQGSGGVGPSGGYTLGFGIKTGENATADTVASAYSSLAITDGKIAGIDGLYMTSQVVNMASDFNVASEKTLTLNAGTSGKIISAGNITGEGKLSLQGTGNSEVRLQGRNTYAGGTEVNVAKLSLNSQKPLGTGAVVFNSATEVTLDASAEQGWYEGSIVKSGMETTATPEKMVQTPNATNTGTTIGGDTTWVYQSSNLVADKDFTMYFGKMYDDAGYLKITDITTGTETTVINDATWNYFATGQYDFVKGHLYEIDLRVYNGGGGSGPFPGNGNANTSGMPDNVGFGASTSGFTADGMGDASFTLMNFDENGALCGSALQIANMIIFDQPMTLNQDVSFDSQNGTKAIFNGQITGTGALTMRNGDYRLTNAKNAVGGFTLENSAFYLSETDGKMTIDGDLSIEDSTVYVNLTGLSEADGWKWLDATGNVNIVDTDWIFSFEGELVGDLMTVTLASGTVNPDLAESLTYSLTNSDLRGFLTSDASGLYFTLGNSTAIPEPATWALLVFGGLGLLVLRNRKKA